MDTVLEPEHVHSIAEELVLSHGIPPTFMVLLLEFYNKLDKETKDIYKKINMYQSVYTSLLAIIETSASAKTMLNIIPKIKQIMILCYPNLHTRRTLMSTLKKHVQFQFSLHPKVLEAAKQFCLELSEYKELDEKYNKKVIARNKDQKKVSNLDIMKIVAEFKGTARWDEKMVILGLTTGARMCEIAKLSTFEVSDKGEGFIRVVGVAKTKDRRIFDKPLVAGITPTEVISMAESVREMLVRFFGLSIEHMHHSTITSTLSKRLCPLVKTILSDHVGGNLNFHTLRSLYAEMAWYEQEGKHTYSKPAFYAQILGHKETDITTALSYQKFDMKKEIVAEPAPKEEKKEEKKKTNKRDKKVYFLGKNGRFFLERVHRGDRMKALDEQTKQLVKNGVKPTYYQLKRLGYGTKLIQTYKKKAQTLLL